jgi:ankyrin repeat protein
MLLPHVGIRGLELRDVERRTALHYASRGGHAGVIRVLLLAGADHTVTDSEGMTPRAIVEQNETLACVEVFQVSASPTPYLSSDVRCLTSWMAAAYPKSVRHDL